MLCDINVSVGNWPFADFNPASVGRLLRHLEAEGINEALVSPVESILLPDPDIANARLYSKIKTCSGFRFVPVVNPLLKNWRAIIDRYGGESKFFKVFPGYHGYSPAGGDAGEFFAEMQERGKIVMIQIRVEDERNQAPVMRVAGVPVEDIKAAARKFPSLKLVCLCAYYGDIEELFKETENVYADISFAEKFRTLRSIIDLTGRPDRLLFGSHTPFLYTRASVMKLNDASVTADEKELISGLNIKRLMASGGGDRT